MDATRYQKQEAAPGRRILDEATGELGMDERHRGHLDCAGGRIGRHRWR